jgi:hypothetical protein
LTPKPKRVFAMGPLVSFTSIVALVGVLTVMRIRVSAADASIFRCPALPGPD